MATITVIRHAQASFGAADYDKLSELGRRQSRALGRALAAQGLAPGGVMIGAQRRHRETYEGIALGLGLGAAPAAAPTAEPVVHPGLNEFDFKGLLEARARTHPLPEGAHDDRGTHFRVLRDTVIAWQRDEIEAPPERFADFTARVQAAMDAALATGQDMMLVSSGGAIGQMIRAAMDAPAEAQIRIQLQMKNCAVNRFVSGRTGLWLHGYNETPHITATNAAKMLTYS